MDRERFREGKGETGESLDKRRPNPTKGTRPPPPTDREGFREGRGWDWGESGQGVWEEESDFGEEWSVLRLGMVSEGGEYGSKSSRQVRKIQSGREPDPHYQRIERDSERGEGVTGGREDKRRPNPTKGTRPPTTNGLRGVWGEKRENGGRGIIGRVKSLFHST